LDASCMSRLLAAEARGRIERGFRRVFDIADDAVESFIVDPQGMPLRVGMSLLDYLLAKGEGREAYFAAARATVERPFETWLVLLRQADGSVVVRKRYIGLFEERALLVVAERSRDGWLIFNAHPRKTIDSQRVGHLVRGFK
ncbi:MAG: hypothetical protein KC466_10500, partial [Myxococcales bacterium]|nr:hypothetical protein [Myxococcales bacterium]